MSSFVVYSCHCYNIRIHLSTKYSDDNLEGFKKDATVQTPLFGWEFDLGMGGIVTEFLPVVKSKSVQSGWKTFECLNCNCGDLYSVADQTSSTQVVVHKNAIHGEDIEKLKHNPQYSQIFNIKLSEDIKEDLIPMPSVEDVPGKLVSTHNQIQNLMDQSAERLRLESKTRIEEFKQLEEKRLQELLSKAKLENTQLWSKIIRVTNEQSSDDKKEKSHVRFAPVVEDDRVSHPIIKKANFDLDESAISSSLKDKNLDHLKLKGEEQQPEEDEEEEEEDMFNLDEEFSDEEKEINKKEDSDEEEDKENDDKPVVSSSFKKSISEIDQKFSWIKKKRNTSKYLTQDFDIKSDFKRGSKSEEDPSAVSLYATSVPITIHYPSVEEKEDEEKKHENDSKPMKKDLLASSFANIDFSYSDRMLSEQFPAPRRRKSLASTSLVNPQLDSLVGKSLDTRGLMKKKKNELERKDDREEFDTSLPPHIWAAMESIDE